MNNPHLPRKKSPKKCRTLLNLEENIVCKKEIYATALVRVFYEISGVRRWKKLSFCKAHYIQFLEEKGKDWVLLDKDNKPYAQIIAYKPDVNLDSK